MKKIIAMACMSILVSACTTNPQATSETPTIGLANPASENCVNKGGRLELRNESNGQVGYCHLPDGQVIEEWALMRSEQSECVPEEAKKLIGKSHLSDEKIKQLTQSFHVRTVLPNQAVTQDYRADRITIVIDPNSKVIRSASCG